MVRLENEFLRIDIDDNARVTHFEDVRSGRGNLITAPEPLYRLNLHTCSNYEDMAFAMDQEASVALRDGCAVISIGKIRSRIAVSDIALELRIALDGDHVYFGATLDNRSGSTVSELFYPCLGMLGQLDGGRTDLLWPEQLGSRICGIEGYLKKQKKRESTYLLTANYPGPLSMSWMMLEGSENCLYFANEDPKFHVTSFRARGSRNGGVTLELNKFCFVKPGQTFEFPRTAVRLYKGRWTEGAREYAAYASSWRHPVKAQDWVRRMNGYFLVINRQQYGDDIWPYDTLPHLYDLAQAHGYDALGLFGWFATGHDNNYPDLEVSSSMGGRDALEKGIKDVQAKGGHVTLYFQGHLMDVNSPFYRELGYKLEGRTVYGNPYYEYYPKACSSDFARSFSKRVFATVCPSCPEWHSLMADKLDMIAGLGADGALYDQIGGMPPYPCFNEEHPHADGRPSLSYTQGRIGLHGRLRKRAETHERFAYFSEHVTDVYSQFLDCVHGIKSAPTVQVPDKSPDAYCGERMMPQMFRYCFPETNVTVRNPRPYTEERIANYAFVFGLKLEMELRYLTDREDIESDCEPSMREYCKKIADLRRRYEKYLLLGTFRAEDGIDNPYMSLIAERFTAEDGSEAIALWNDSHEVRALSGLTFDGEAAYFETPDRRGDGMITELGAGEAAIVVLK